jgi:DNA processing protein
VARVGPVEAAERIRAAAVPLELQQDTEARRDNDCAAADLKILDGLGGRLITRDDEEWPVLAFGAFRGFDGKQRSQAHPPLVLWAVGEVVLPEVVERSAAIVGTRASTAYGEHVAADFAAGLAARDVAVVSGGAFGIDGAAHRATLATDGITVAVLASGVDLAYPSGHSSLQRRIGADGLLLSEYPPGMRPARYRFLTRNRLVAALTGATVVVEAGARSGAANTAAWARGLGRVVCAVPGPVTSSASVGCHALLRSGAELVTRAEDIVELVGRAGELAPEEARPTTPLDGLSDVEKRVYEALPARGHRSVDQIAVACGVPAEQLFAPLAVLEVSGLITREEGCWRLTRKRAKV